MSLSHVATRSYRDRSGTAFSSTETISADAEVNVSVSIPQNTNTTEAEVDFAVVRANLKSLAIYCTQALTIKTNHDHTGSPDDTISLVAGQNLMWTLAQDTLAKCPFSTTVTKLYVVNLGDAVELVVRALVDITP